MRWKLTLWLVLLNAVLFAYLWHTERGRAARAQFEAVDRLVFPALTRAPLTEVRLTDANGATQWVVRRDDDAWRLTAPVEWAANPFAVSRLEEALATLTAEVRLPGDAREARGLAAGATELTVINARGDTTILRIGAPTIVGQGLYAQRAGENDAMVIDRGFSQAIGEDPTVFLEPTFLDFDPTGAETITISNFDGGLRRVLLARSGDDWELQSPLRAPADAAALATALLQLDQAQVAGWPEPDRQAPDSPALEIELDANGLQRRISIGPPVEPGSSFRWARHDGSPTAVAVDGDLFAPWFEAQSAFRDAQFFTFEPAAVSTLEIMQDGFGVRLQSLADGGWQVFTIGPQADGAPQPGDEDEIAAVLDTLRLLRAEQFASDAPSEDDIARFGLDAPQRRVRVTFREAAATPLSLQVGAFTSEERFIYVQRENRPFIYAVPRALAGTLPVDALAYRSRELDRLPQDVEIVEMRLEHVDQAEAAWTWTPAIEPADERAQAAILTLQDQARVFRARRLVRDGFENPFRLDATTPVPLDWRWRILARVPGASEPLERTWHLSERLGGTSQFAGSPAQALTVVLPAPVVDALAQFWPSPLDTLEAPELPADAEIPTETAPPSEAASPADAGPPDEA